MLIFFANRGPIRGGRQLEREGRRRTDADFGHSICVVATSVGRAANGELRHQSPPVLPSHGSTEQLRSAANGLLKGHERARIKQPLDGRREGGDESRTAKAKIFSINGSDRIQWDVSTLILRCCYIFVQQI